MLIKKASQTDIKPSEITDKSVWENRRQFLKQAAIAGVGASLSATSLSSLAAGAEHGKKIPGLVKTGIGENLEPTDFEDITSYNNYYEFGTSKRAPAKNAHTLVTDKWSIKVDGECEKPGTISLEDILTEFPQEERIYRFRCVEAWGMVVPWVGFPLGDLLKKFKPTSRAKYVVFRTLADRKQMPKLKDDVLDWPYTEGLRMDEAMNPLALLATGLYGEVLPNQNGAPIRLVVPWKYGFKSIKSIVSISLVETVPKTTWWRMAPKEYGFYANVNPKVDHPRWSQKYHRMIGEGIFARKKKTLMFNGYAEQVAGLYKGMDLKKFY